MASLEQHLGRLGLSQRRQKTSVRGRTESTMSSNRNKSEEEESKPLLISTSSNNQETLSAATTNHGYTIVPLQQRSTVARWDVLPFALLYIALIAIDQTTADVADDVSGADLFKTILFGFVLVLHLAIVILQQWKVSIQVWVGYKKMIRSNEAAYRKKWTHCWVKTAASSSGHVDSAIVAVQHQQQQTSPSDSMVSVLTFQDVVFRAPNRDPEMDDLWSVSRNKESSRTRVDDELEMFHTLRYPVDFPLDFYSGWRGWITLHDVKQASRVYGENITSIQLPPFLDLLAEQLLAPFFLFQLFCVVLWSLDEYWYYAIFTLLALLMFECTVANNRLRGLQRLRGTLRHAYHVRCFRHNQWTVSLTNELLPGDIVSMRTSSADETHVPADMLVLGGGTAVVDEALLTGESTPQLKSPIDGGSPSSNSTLLDLQEHKTSILFGGTMLVSQDSTALGSNGHSPSIGPIPPPPDNGVVCMVLRTGFETAQGSLLRSMAHSSMKSADGIHTRDTFLFVGMLLLCAIASAAMVLREGWHDETRNRFRLLLHVIIIVTSVVPPELPMELSLAVTNSVADLMRNARVYCTEPYRIPWAGRVDMCCFDKTGTLTSDQMQLRGVRLLDGLGLNPDWEQLLHPSEQDLPWEVLRVMAGCHALALTMKRHRQSNGATIIKDVIGNPLEKAVLKDTGYMLQSSNAVVAKDQDTSHPKLLTIHHRFAFSSRLKRMTTLLTEDGGKDVWAVTKGAPETIKDFLTQDSIPENYDSVYKQQMMLGRRVLGMAYRKVDATSSRSILSGSGKKLRRESVEQELTFCGFLVLDCPLKHDSKSVITELKKSGHDVVMITGDAVLTAAEVARQVGITPKRGKRYELRKKDEEAAAIADDLLCGFEFVPLQSEEQASEANSSATIALSRSSLKNVAKLRSQASFCVSGATLLDIATAARDATKGKQSSADSDDSGETTNVLLHSTAQAVLKDLCPLISVFARHAPRQKEAVVAAFNLGHRHTLMCGDGTNDVGALKRAHVGISIISAPEVEAKYRDAADKVKKAKKKQSKKTAATKKASSRKRRSNEEALKQSLRAALQDAQKELDQVELGDASVASPFTSRSMSIQCCKDVLQQGRCTLVTMLEIYKILGVNCLVNALVLTKLHMHGVKQGDRQLTILGMAVALLFFFVTRGKPLPTLSPRRPPSSVLCVSALVSIAAQFGIHLGLILLATEISLTFVDPYDPSITPDAAFYPNVLNTCTFLLTMVATVNTFAVNYRGKPFMQDLKDNKMLRRSLQLCYAVLFICALEIFPPLNELFQLSPFPDTAILFGEDSMDDDWIVSIVHEDGASPLTKLVGQVGFQLSMAGLLLVDTIAVFAVERIILWWFD